MSNARVSLRFVLLALVGLVIFPSCQAQLQYERYKIGDGETRCLPGLADIYVVRLTCHIASSPSDCSMRPMGKPRFRISDRKSLKTPGQGIICVCALSRLRCSKFPLWLDHQGHKGILSDGSTGQHPYSGNRNCRFIIDTEISGPIRITFNRFDTEKNRDLVVIYDGPDELKDNEIGAFRGLSHLSKVILFPLYCSGSSP